MTISAYDISIPLFIPSLTGLSIVLEKGARFIDERGLDHANFINSRVYPDMFPFQLQVRICTGHTLRVCELLGSLEVPKLGTDETSLAELKARVDRTIDFLRSVTREQFAGADDKEINHKFRSGIVQRFTGITYLTEWCLPNFYFHLTTAYNILRGLGVEVTKRDYMGGELPK